MSTDRVEIKPDTPKETRTLEQSAEDLKKNAGIDVSKDSAVNANGETATLTENKQEDLQKSSEDVINENEKRPEWLPEKFKNAEELSKAYTELEKQYSGRQKEETKPEEASSIKVSPTQITGGSGTEAINNGGDCQTSTQIVSRASQPLESKASTT